MWAKQLKDKKIRINFFNKEIKSLPISFLVSSPSLEKVYRFALTKKYNSLNTRFFKTQVKNRCVLSLRSRSTLRKFRLSRIVFRTFASSGLLLGVKKSSW